MTTSKGIIAVRRGRIPPFTRAYKNTYTRMREKNLAPLGAITMNKLYHPIPHLVNRNAPRVWISLNCSYVTLYKYFFHNQTDSTCFLSQSNGFL